MKKYKKELCSNTYINNFTKEVLNMSETEKQDWHLSKSVPLTIIFGVILQTITLVWFFAVLRSDVDINRANILRLDTRTEQLEAVVQSQSLAIARMDENIAFIRASIERMERMRSSN
jgi:hypothetical protein